MITVLTIAGLDPSAGAGALADIKTISAFGCYGVAAITSITEQNTQGVFGARHVDLDLVSRQIKVLLDDFDVAAAKTGMLPTAECVKVVAQTLAEARIRNLVVDPVLRSTSGYPLADSNVIDALVKYLLPLASLVTPNASEAAAITNIEVKGIESMERAARAMIDLGARAVLVKGGDIEGPRATDVLVDQRGCVVLSEEKIDSRNTHGTGCALASAIACLLGTGHSVEESARSAKRYVVEAIRTAPGLGRGQGPLNQFIPGFFPPERLD